MQSGGIYAYDGYFNSLFVNPGHGNRWIALELEGVESNRDAIGTRVRVRVRESGRTRDITRWVGPRGSFGSGPFRLHIGLGQAEEIESVEVYWPKTDTAQTFEGLEMNTFYRVVEFEDGPQRLERKRIALGS